MATATQEKSSQEGCCCPYWAPLTCSCLLVKDDLFIPLKSHIAVYCFSSRFSLCPYYLQLADAANQTKEKQKNPSNHRRSTRIPGYRSFRFTKLIDKQLFKTKEDTTWTFDVSDHGVRFASEQILTHDTVIHFFVEDDTSATTVEGIGRVVWCAPLHNTSLFQVGAAITWLLR